MVPILSVNANSWTTLRGYLEDSKVMVVFGRELVLRGDAAQEASAKTYMLKVPQQMPVRRLEGPLVQEDDWADSWATVEEACMAAACGSHGKGHHLSGTYKASAGKAGTELAVLTGAGLRKRGARGGAPGLTSGNVLGMDQMRPPGKLDEFEQARQEADRWRMDACRIKGLGARAGGTFPGVPAISGGAMSITP